MDLVIDIGNSRAKLFLFKNSKIIDRINTDLNLIEDVLKLVSDKNQIKNIICSTVSVKIDDLIKQFFNDSNFISLSNDKIAFPFVNNYKNKKTLGQDRIALISSSIFLYPKRNSLIIDLGTCITYDIIDSNNNYFGGAISPGFPIRYKSLNSYTENLPLLEIQKFQKIIGNDTNQSIHSGITNGIIGEINQFINELNKDFENLNVIITGGYSKYLVNRIKNVIFADQDFLAFGLNHILKLNEEN